MLNEPSSKEITAHFLLASTLFVSTKPCQIQTVLGSCVAVCLFDTKLRTGGMNHFMMPLWNGEGLASPKFGNIAIDMLIEKMKSNGSQKQNLVAKIFGGANQLEHQNSIFFIGERNIQITEYLLKNHQIPISARSLGGTQGRKILFNTFTGEVLMKYIIK